MYKRRILSLYKKKILCLYEKNIYFLYKENNLERSVSSARRKMFFTQQNIISVYTKKILVL